jgi:two-component system chemotaxis response regulator CheY
MRFLIVDDSMPMRRIMTNVLARLGHSDVVEAANGREALDRLDEAMRVDFVITDLFMPGVNGLDFLRIVRERPDMRDVPVVVVTGNASRSAVLQAKRLGANGYILKPFTAELLKERIENLCPQRDGDDPGNSI